MRLFNLLTFLLFSFYMTAQGDYDFDFIDNEYDYDIATATLKFNGSPTGFPVIRLGSSDYLLLDFDDLANVERDFYYRIIHCDKDWNESSMREIDYLNGFNDERLRNYVYSSNTRIQFLHYWQKFPNSETRFKISGNYLLVIYENDIRHPILTRRFIVSENISEINIHSIFPSDVENIRYKQELEVMVDIENSNFRNPLEELSLVMLQNENWLSTKSAIPNILSGKTLKFNRLGTFQWWGNAEFRDFDIRSFHRVGKGVKFVERKYDGTDILMELTESRRNKPHIAQFDFNGRYFVENWDRTPSTPNLDLTTNMSAAEIQNVVSDIIQSLTNSSILAFRNNQTAERNIYSDYAYLTLYYEDNIQLEPDEEIYIIGGFNNWLPSEDYKLTFDPGRDMYFVNLFLKQGYYNYYFAVVDGKGNVDIPLIEGSWNETENDYQVIAYYRGLGDLYDRVVGYKSYNTNSELRRY